MTNSKVARYFLCFVLFLTILGGLSEIQVQAAEGIPSSLKVGCDYPVVPGKSTDTFYFWCTLTWFGPEGKTFNLITKAPPGWTSTTTKLYPDEEIGAIWIKKEQYYAEQFKVVATPVTGYNPEPGDYMITLEAVSDDGEVQTSVELTAVVTALYEYEMITANGKLNTEAVAGEDNPLALVLENTGTAPITNITFSSTKLESWGVIFNPEKIDSLEPGSSEEVTVEIEPPHNRTIAGDYYITLSAESTDYVPDSLAIRVTILTPMVWNVVGILMVVVVAAGLGVLFWRLSKR